MNGVRVIMGVMGGILAFFFGLFIVCFLMSLMGVGHPMVVGTITWVVLLGWMAQTSYNRARRERLEQMRIVQASVERQAQADRDAQLINKPLWDS